jgi:diguanylate cyclase (GGDEF)-like protein
VEVAARALGSISRKEGEFSLLLDEQFDILWHSDSLAPILGWTDVIGRNGTEFVHPDDLELVLMTMLQANSNDGNAGLAPSFTPESSDIRLLDVAGNWHTFETTTWNHLEDLNVRGVLCTCRRVQDRSDLGRAIDLLGSGAAIGEILPLVARLADHSLGGGEVRTVLAWLDGERLRTASAPDSPVLDSSLSGCVERIWSDDLSGPIVVTELGSLAPAVSQAAARAGYKGAFLVPIEAPTSTKVIGGMIAWGTSTVDFQAPPQSPIHVALRLAALTIADHNLKQELRWAASHDPLTGLANRAQFGRRLDALAGGDLVLLYIDLDDFKPINDIHGHHVGDRVLVEVARRIPSVVGPHDVVGRLGGDEFAVICAGVTDPSEGRAVGDRIIRAIRQPIVVDGFQVSVGASVGVAVGAQPLIPAVLARRADEALYQAKSAGKNTVCLAA